MQKAPQLTICRADELLDKVAKLKPAVVLSIEHPGATPDQSNYSPRLTDGTPQMIMQFFDYPFENGPGGPDIEQVEQGLAFVMERITKGPAVIHCTVGRSRSVAMALGVLSALYPRESEKALIKKLIEIRPIAAPNILVVEMVDKLTGRNGKLLQAVLDDKKLTAAREAAAIEREKWIKKYEEAQKKPKGNTP